MLFLGDNMNNILLILIAFCIGAFGFYWAERFDRFARQGGLAPRQNKEQFAAEPLFLPSEDALIFVDKASEHLFACAKSKSTVPFTLVHDTATQKKARFKIAAAISQNDLDNILFCSQIKKANSTFTIALCNNQIYKNIFKGYNIDIIAFSVEEALLALDSYYKRQVAGL